MLCIILVLAAMFVARRVLMPEVANETELDQSTEETLRDMFLTFVLGDEEYGLEIRYITEIVGLQKITEVPDMPNFVKGVVNLRGLVIPVIDMRLRFGLEAKDYDERTCIIVVNVRNIQLGLVVDTVNEVRTILPDQIDTPPKVAVGKSQRYIMGLGKVGDEVKILLDANKVMFEEELENLASV
jgi:purine-binding chemotaxis protein CheW